MSRLTNVPQPRSIEVVHKKADSTLKVIKESTSELYVSGSAITEDSNISRFRYTVERYSGSDNANLIVDLDIQKQTIKVVSIEVSDGDEWLAGFLILSMLSQMPYFRLDIDNVEDSDFLKFLMRRGRRCMPSKKEDALEITDDEPYWD